MRRLSILAALSALLAALAAGCGGGGSGSPAGGTGEPSRAASVRIAVQWPEPSRNLPITAVRVELVARRASDNGFLGQTQADRTSGQNTPSGTTSQMELSNLPVGQPIRFEFKAYGLSKPGDPLFDPAFSSANPVAVQAAEVVRTLHAGLNPGAGDDPAQFAITLDSTVRSLNAVPVPSIGGTGTQADPYQLTFGDTTVPLTAEARDAQSNLVLLRYDPASASANPQVTWRVNSGPLTFGAAGPTAGGVDVVLGITSPVSGVFSVDVEHTNYGDNARVTRTVFFQISLATEGVSRFKTAASTLAAVADADAVDIAARIGVGGGDEVFVLGGTAGAGSQVSATTVTVPTSGPNQGVPQFAASPDFSVPGLALRRVARHADPFGFLATDGDRRIYTFRRFPSNTQNLAPERTLDLAGSPISGVNVARIEDVDAADNRTTFYMLYTATGGTLQVAKINKNFNGEEFLRGVVVGGSPPSVPRRLALYRDTDGVPAQPVFFVLADNEIRVYVNQNPPPAAPLAIPPQGANNPSGETLGTVLDIACSGNALYALSSTPAGPRVHIFTIDPGNPAGVAYSRSRLVADETNPNQPVQIRSLVSTAGSNDIYVAILNSQNRPAFIATTEL